MGILLTLMCRKEEIDITSCKKEPWQKQSQECSVRFHFNAHYNLVLKPSTISKNSFIFEPFLPNFSQS